MHKCAVLPQIKVENIFEHGHMFYVVMILTYNPHRWIPWSYVFHVEGSAPSPLRKYATKYDTREKAENALDKMVDSIEVMHYDSVS